MITIKKPNEIKLLREGGALLGAILRTLGSRAIAGVTTAELDAIAEALIRKHGGVPSFKNYQTSPDDTPFPSTICASVNDEVVHGIASDYALQNGDVVSLDIGMRWPANDGFYTDTAITVAVGTITDDQKTLLTVTHDALLAGIAVAKPGKYIHDISAAIEEHIKPHGFGIVRQLVGHGVGYAIHEEPRIPNYTHSRQQKIELKPGMVLAIEPMVTLGGHDVDFLDDGWTVVTADGSTAAHFEHTVVITQNGCEILTQPGAMQL